MTWPHYSGDDYVDFEFIESFCRQIAAAHPEWVELREAGRSHHDRPLLLLILGAQDQHPGDLPRGQRPALWLDAGTHASEFTGVSALLFTISQWLQRLTSGDTTLQRWFSQHDVVAMPCISPDGVQQVFEGGPFLRSSLSPPRHGQVRTGLDPCDINGDGKIRMMRWKDPAGPFVCDNDWAPFLRPRHIDDDPADAYFVASEGEFINWDGIRWTTAPRAHGVDLNRNFPGHWEPFSMFGSHGGSFTLSEPESRAVVDTFASHPHICCALTMHTYTGCILTQPYRKDSPLTKPDIDLMELLAKELARDTTYDVFRVYPDFTYDMDRSIVGVWADTIATVFGVPGYTIECWNPFKHAKIDVDNPLDFLLRPDPDRLRLLLQAFAADEHNVMAWQPFHHPQLGPVEVGGIEYLRTIRNPPTHLLATECQRVFQICEKARLSLPSVSPHIELRPTGDAHTLRITLENLGFLPTSGLAHGTRTGASPHVSISLHPDPSLRIETPLARELPHLEGWGNLRVGPARHNVYADLSTTGHRQLAEWTIHGSGTLTIRWQAGRAGRGETTLKIDP